MTQQGQGNKLIQLQPVLLTILWRFTVSPTVFSSASPHLFPSIHICFIFLPICFCVFFHYCFTLSTESARPLWSREDWTTDWTIYFCKETSVSNHSISRCLYWTGTHARLFLIETLLLVNRVTVTFVRNTACVFLSVCVCVCVCSVWVIWCIPFILKYFL